MFKVNDLVWLPIGDGWGEDWGIVMGIDRNQRRRGQSIEFYYHIYWMKDQFTTTEDNIWAHKECKHCASIKIKSDLAGVSNAIS
jgi:hypothetical protein